MTEMDMNNMDLEHMRKAWVEMGKALGMDTPPSDPDDISKKKTALDELLLRYMKGRDFSLVGAIVFAIIFFSVPSLNDEYKRSMAISFAILMLANAYALNWFQKGIGKINPLTMSISKVASMAKYYRKCHLKYYMIAFPISLIWLGYFIYIVQGSDFRGNEGLVIGAIIGSIFTIYSLWKDLRDYRNLTK